jgi:cbb3-type cytochrome oxidase maturation protein
MEVMYLLIAFSLLIATGFLLAFIWAVRSGQYDDRYTPSVRILFDDIRPDRPPGDDRGCISESKDPAGDGKSKSDGHERKIPDDNEIPQ